MEPVLGVVPCFHEVSMKSVPQYMFLIIISDPHLGEGDGARIMGNLHN